MNHKHSLFTHQFLIIVSLLLSGVHSLADSFRDRVLGIHCQSFFGRSQSSLCQPAFLGFTQKRTWAAQLAWGNNIRYTNEISELLGNRANQDTIDRLFRQQEASELVIDSLLSVQQEQWAVKVRPFSFSYYSEFRNPTLPEIKVTAFDESSAAGLVGHYLGANFFVGAELKVSKERWLNRQFFLTDLIAEGRDEFLQSTEQTLFFFDPGVVYEPERTALSDWTPRVTAKLKSNPINGVKEEYPRELRTLNFTASVQPEYSWGGWGASLGTTAQNYKDAELAAGAFIQFGILTLLGNTQKSQSSLGFEANLNHLSLGVGQVRTRYQGIQSFVNVAGVF